MVVLWLGCRCCRPSVNIICGRIMIGLSLSSVSKHNMWSYCDYDILCLLTDDNNDNPIIIRSHIVFTDEDNDNPIIIRPHIVFTDGRHNHNTTTYCVYWRTCGRIMIGLSLSSVSKLNMWTYYDWRQKWQPNHNTTTYCVYWWTTTTTTQS
jgi:hypothetical protein